MSRPRWADLAFVNGRVFTVDAAGTWAEAVAVAGGRIASVGSDAEVRGLVGLRTEVVDLGGRSLLPGFQDAHAHVMTGGLDRMRVDLSGVGSYPEYASLIGDYAAANPERDWIVGGGWMLGAFPGGTPTAEALDRVVPERPAFLGNRDNHGAWVNTRALELAGVTRETADPPDGRIERDPTGAPTGTLHEGAVRLVRRIVPRPTHDELVAALLEGQRYLHSVGVTAWQDAIVGEYETMFDSYDAYRAAAADGRLTGRVVGALWWRRGEGLAQLPYLLDRRERGQVGRFQATTVKIMADGVCENQTASVLTPWLDGSGRATGNTGIPFVPRDELLEVVPALDAEGFQVHIHAIGDRAARDALDAFEAARRANGWTDTRPHIAHLQVVHPDDRPRFRRLGVTANFQPLWLVHEPQMDALTIPFLGAERAGWQYPLGSLAASGATIAMGSDWPVSSADPFWEMHVAVNHLVPEGYPYGDGSGRVFMPEERIALPVALRAFTMGSAYVNHLDRETGSIEVGKAADLVVVDRDVFDSAPDRIADARVLLALVEGERVYEAPGL